MEVIVTAFFPLQMAIRDQILDVLLKSISVQLTQNRFHTRKPAVSRALITTLDRTHQTQQFYEMLTL